MFINVSQFCAFNFALKNMMNFTQFKKIIQLLPNRMFGKNFGAICEQLQFKLVLFILFGLFFQNKVLVQNPGNSANFSIYGEVYSGISSPGVHDWLLGTTDIGVFDQSQTTLFTNITNSLSNTRFLARQKYFQDQTEVNIFYDAGYARNYVNYNSLFVGKIDLTSFNQNGYKNVDSLSGTWLETNSNLLSKNDIVDIYAHLRSAGTTVGNNLIFNMGDSTLGSSVDHFVDFELNLESLDCRHISYMPNVKNI